MDEDIPIPISLADFDEMIASSEGSELSVDILGSCPILVASASIAEFSDANG